MTISKETRIVVFIKHLKKQGLLCGSQFDFHGNLHYMVEYKKQIIPLTKNQFYLVTKGVYS